MDIQFGNLSNLNLLWIVAAAVAAMLLAVVWRRRAAARFATANLVGRMQAASGGGRQFVKAVFVTAALLALVLALVDVRWGKSWREVPQKGIEVMFVLDVSRSMLAEDATPNRLQRAKQQVDDMLEVMAGDRVGLVVFAGEPRQLVPLTSHFQDFKQTLSDVGPEAVARGGSRLGDALQLAADGFLEQTGDHKAVVVFTDGEDQESEPVAVAEQLHRDQGIRIFTVGLGDMDQGARIPERNSSRQRSYMQYRGQQVWSKMNGAVLKQVAIATDGAYIPAGTKQVDMAAVYHQFLANVDQQDFETARINSYVPRYQWFVGVGLLLLAIDTLLPSARRSYPLRSASVGSKLRSVFSGSFRTSRAASKGIAAACLATLLLLPHAASAAEPASLVRQANEALHAGNLDQALADYQQAAQTDPNRPELLYNQAVAQYRKGDYEQARQLLCQAASSADDRLDSRVRYNLANCDYAEAVQLADRDKPAAISRLQSAIGHYRATLTANPNDTDARANIQTAQMLVDKLQQEEEQKKQQQQDEQQQQEQEQEQQQQEQEQEQQQQQQQQQQDDQQSEQEKQGRNQQNQQEQQQQDQNDEQQSAGQQQDQQSRPQQDEAESQQERSAERDEARHEQENDSRQPQDQADQQPSSSNHEQSSQEQSGEQDEQQDRREPSGTPPEQTEQTEQPEANQPPRNPSGTGQVSGPPQFGHTDSTAPADARPMTREEAQKMLQAVRDRELLRRLEQRRQIQRHRAPVDRDW